MATTCPAATRSTSVAGAWRSLTLGMNGPTRLTLSFLHQTDDNLPDFGVPALNGKRLDGVSREAYFGWRNLDKRRSVQRAHRQARARLLGRPQLQNLTRYSSLSRDTTVSASHVDLRMRPGYYKPAGPQAMAATPPPPKCGSTRPT